jgi:hypothetical protein
MKSCSAAQKRFLLFKGPGFFKKNFKKIGGNTEDLQAYGLIPHPPPPPWSFYSTFKGTVA